MEYLSIVISVVALILVIRKQRTPDPIIQVYIPEQEKPELTCVHHDSVTELVIDYDRIEQMISKLVSTQPRLIPSPNTNPDWYPPPVIYGPPTNTMTVKTNKDNLTINPENGVEVRTFPQPR